MKRIALIFIFVILYACDNPITVEYQDPRYDQLVIKVDSLMGDMDSLSADLETYKTNMGYWISSISMDILALQDDTRRLFKLDSAINEELKRRYIIDSIQARFIEVNRQSLEEYKADVRNWDSIQWYLFKSKTDSILSVFNNAIGILLTDIVDLYTSLELMDSALNDHLHDAYIIQTDTLVVPVQQIYDNVILHGYEFDSIYFETDSAFNELLKRLLGQ